MTSQAKYLKDKLINIGLRYGKLEDFTVYTETFQAKGNKYKGDAFARLSVKIPKYSNLYHKLCNLQYKGIKIKYITNESIYPIISY